MYSPFFCVLGKGKTTEKLENQWFNGCVGFALCRNSTENRKNQLYIFYKKWNDYIENITH